MAATSTVTLRKQRRLERAGAQVWLFEGRRVPLKALLQKLAKQGALNVIIEGGSETLGSFFDAGLIDRVYWFISPVVIGSAASLCAVAGRGAAELTLAPRLHGATIETAGKCWMIRGNVSRWALA